MSIDHILVVDVGNTRAKFGVFEIRSQTPPLIRANSAVRLATCDDPGREVAKWLQDLNIHVDMAMVAGSNPPDRDRLLSEWPVAIVTPRVLLDGRDVPILVDVDDPAAVGIDRLLTAFAAHRLHADRQPAIVVDSGTATTVNLVTSDGAFRGGTILPGLRLSAHALHDYTARLPFLDTDKIAERVTEKEAPVPGRNTEDAMKSGLFWGQLGAIQEISRRLAVAAESTFGDQKTAVCIVTGGGGRQLADHLMPCVYVDSLALHGMALLAK